MENREEIQFELDLLNVDQLRKIVRSNESVKWKCEKEYVQVNRTPKNHMISYILSMHPDYGKLKNQIKEFNKPTELFDDVQVVEETTTKVSKFPKLKHKTQQSKTQQSMEGNQMKIDLGLDLGAVISTAVQNLLEGQREELINKQINVKVEKEVAKLKPTLIRIPERKDVKIEGKQHKVFKDVLYYCQIERQVFIAGPSGSGKTYMASQVAKGLGVQFKHISCSAGLSEAHLLGRMLFDGTYVKSDFVDCYENGGVFLFDEIDAADANTLLVVNSALANGSMSVPNRKENPVAKRHKDFICICAGNTWGSGSIEYSGRNYMDAAFMDRFAASKVVVDYDEALEKDICDSHALYTTLNNLRKAVAENKIRRIISTRVFISAKRQHETGKSIKAFVNSLMVDWSQEEKSKIKFNEILAA